MRPRSRVWDSERPKGKGSQPKRKGLRKEGPEFACEGGAAWGTRTHDPIITNDVLYQLS